MLKLHSNPISRENKDRGLHQSNPMFLTRTIKMSKPTVNGRLIGPEISGGIDGIGCLGRVERASLGTAWKTNSAQFSTRHSKGSLLPPVFPKCKSLKVSLGHELPSWFSIGHRVVFLPGVPIRPRLSRVLPNQKRESSEHVGWKGVL